MSLRKPPKSAPIPDARSKTGSSGQPKAQSSILETVKTVVYAILIALVVRTILIEPFNIPSRSMLPTLLVGDYLFVSKYSYGYSRHSLSLFGYSIPFSFGGTEGRVLGSGPERGDVAVFKLPRDGKTDYIKRIVGLPGDRIQVLGGILHINDEPVKRERTQNYVDAHCSGNAEQYQQYIETLPNGRQHLILERSDTGHLDNTDVYTVPSGYYFAMGDNRDNSTDSRVLDQVGYVPAENLVGRAEFLFFSKNECAGWWEFWKWPTAIRFSRMFTAVE